MENVNEWKFLEVETFIFLEIKSAITLKFKCPFINESN